MRNYFPLVSIIMPFYNADKTLRKSIMSIVSQSYNELEIILVDDSSTDSSLLIAQEFCNIDKRIKLIKNNKNIGLAASLNSAIKVSKGRYIARMDSDDYSHPSRIEKQVAFLQKNKKISVLGTAARYIVNNNSKRSFINTMPLSHEECIEKIAKTTPFIHPSVMFHREFFSEVGYYNPTLRKAQDYELWVRAKNKVQFANLSDVLIDYNFAPNKSFLLFANEIKVKMMCSIKYGFFIRAFFYSFVAFSKFLINKIFF